MNGEMLKGHLELLVLTALAEEPGHGYAIIRRIEQRSDGALSLLEGSLYPALHRLEDRGYVSSRWSTVSGRRRRVYALTRRGRSALAEQAQDWRHFQATMNLVLESP